ncbi:NUC194 domain-containing protein, partial [Obelidium mucronatum]
MREREVEGVDNTSGGGGNSKKQAVSISADASKLVADNPADFVVFVAFVSLCDALLPKIQVVLFEKWIFVAGQKLISYSSHHPLVSGFYKLFGVVLTISESLKYFADHDGIPEVIDSQKSAHSLFSNYIAEVLLKMRQFKDDLLVSCLKMSLCLPIIESLKMGLSYTPLAIVALDAIESWAKKLDRKVLKPSYGRVLPSLNDYLMLDLDTGDSVAASTSTGKFAKKSRSKHLKTHGVSEREMDEQAIQTLKTIQIRILKLLGSLGQDSRLMLSDSVANANLIAWDTTKNLKFQIPFKEAIFDVYFDDMLPRIIELAESSPDRKTKVAANELLHALVIIMIGGSQNRSETDARTPYHMIYVKIFPVLLRLAVDLDKVTRELFRPLVIQLVHWLTKNSKYENPETMALLQASFDAVASSNGPLREFGAECIAEYLKWSIKHASEKELENNPINAKSLFKRMYGLCQHSSPTKRLSAAIIVNRIYTIFRESNALVDVFTVEILYYLMFSLKLADGDNPALGTLSLAKIAIDNMAKIIVVKYDIFIRRGNNRRTFPGVDQCDLANVVRWIFEESRSKELEYSYKCIELFDKFAQKLGGVSSPDRYIYNLFDVPEAAIIDEPIGSAKQQSWLLSLRSSLILYRYLIDRNALAPSAIFQLSGVVASITTFLKVCDDKEVSTLTAAVKKWKSDRAFVFLKVLELIHSAHSRLSPSEKTVLDPIFSCQSFYNLLGLTVFEPQAVGFDVALQETKSELFNRTVEVIGSLNRNFSSAFKSKLIAAFAALLASSEIDLRNTDISSRSQTTKYLQATSGLKIVRCCSMLQPVLQKIGTSQSQYMTQILNNISNLLKSNDLVQIELGGSILSECLECEDSRMAAFKTVLCPPTQDQGSIALAKEKYEKLAAFINCGICRYPNSFVEVLQGGVENSLVLLVLDNFLNWLGSPGGSFEKDVESFIQQITETDGFVKTAVLLYDRAGEDVLTRFWRKILQVKPDRLNIAADNAFSETFWNEFFIGFNFKSSLKRLNVLFELLPLVILTPKSQRIEDSLSSIVTEKFPLVSQTVDGTDELLDDYRVSMSKLLNIMQQAAGSTVLERVLILHLCRDANHAFNEAFVDALSIKVPKMTSNVLSELWKFAFEFAVQGKNMPDLRLNVAKTLLLPILQSMQQMISSGAITPNEDEAATKHILVTKTICFFLMETAYKRVPSSELHSATGRVLKSFVGPAKTGEKEITIALIKAGGDFKKKQPLDSAAIAPYRLSLNQSSFNAISACLLATQSLAKVEIFNAYLFVEKPLLWDNIVDTSKSIFISTDLDSPLIRVGIREFSEKSSSLAAKKKYISTQFLADSSLSQMSSLFGKGLPSHQSPRFIGTDLSLNDVVGELELCVTDGILSVINRLPFSDKDIDMPVWMKSLLGKIEKPDTHINIRLFIAKIVINITSVFTPFAKFWWKPIAQLIQDADLFGSGINYFVQDLCLILMEWTKNANSFTKTTDKEVILKTIRWLIRHCNHESKSTIRNHLRIVRALIENWKPYVIAPSDVIFDLLHAKVDVNSKSEKYLNLTGIYVLQSFVANDIAFYDPNGLTDRIFSETEMLDLLNGLLISSKYKELFSPLAECVGDVLAYLDKIGSASRFPFLCKVDEACKRRSALETKSYIQIVNRISVNYPRILESQYKNLLNLFSKLDLDLKGKTLEALLSFADEIPDLFTEIIGLDLEDILRSQDEECQTFTLGILGILAPSLTRQQISKFLPMSVEIFLLHQSDRCRAAFFSLRLVKFSLLRGLSDSDDGIRNSLLEFFNNKVFGRKNLEWYIPEVEDVFLKYSVHFLLEASKLTPVFEQKVYDRGLPDARFNDRDIVVDLVWEKSSSYPSFSMDDNGGAVRMTQDMVWTPTQDVNAKSARNMFSRAPSEFDARSQSQSLSTQPGVNRNTIRRSYATKKESTFFAYDAERKKKESRNIDRFKKSASQRSVTLFRKYREGELPDIEIKHREVIAPLQSLAARDNDISRQLFSYFGDPDFNRSVNGEEIGLAFNTVFRTSSALSAPFIGSLLQVMFNNSELIQRANPALIAHVASGSSNFELGALVIEKGIQDGLFSSSDAKRSKTGARALKKSPEGWVPLASLFKDIKQVEVYQSIYESHIASSVITKEAIAAELLGDFETAKNKYLEGLESENLEANEAEPKLWSTERLECMNKLGEWNDLATSVLHDVDNNIERVWEEDKVDPYLKLFLRSHLKLRNTSAEDSDIDVGAVKTLIEDAKKDVTKRQILEQYFATDLLANAFASNDLNLTRHYVDLSWKRFISSFAGLNPSATTSKMDMLSSLQPICEYDEFLTFAKLARTGTVSKEDIDSVFSTWRVRFPASTDSISIWDDVIGSRKLMISKTSAMFDGLVISNTEDLVAEFHATVVSDDLLYSRQMAKAASKQNLFTAASRWLETANANTGEFVPEFMQLYYKFLLRQSDHENGSMNKFKLLENIIKHMDYYKKSIRNTGPAFQLKFLTLEVRALSRLLNLARDLPSSDSFFIGLASSKSLTKFTGGQKVETKKDLLDFFLSRSKLNIRLLHGLSVPAHNFQKGLIEIGMFVDKALRSIETDSALGSGTGNAAGLIRESAKLIVNSIFRAMAIGSPKAVEFFPRLLQLLDQYPGLSDEFETQSKECPTWMFLRWLPQLTSLLDKPSGLSVLPLVFR